MVQSASCLLCRATHFVRPLTKVLAWEGGTKFSKESLAQILCNANVSRILMPEYYLFEELTGLPLTTHEGQAYVQSLHVSSPIVG